LNISPYIENNLSYAESIRVPRRVHSVDALRGISILLMIFAAVIPFGVLPSWMYHAQSPPPLHHPVPVPGITWVDLIFPFFLFTMGISIPLALEKKLSEKIPLWKIILIQLKRSLLLAVFAIFIYHINPHVISSSPDWKTWLLCLAGYALLFPVLGRFPAKLNKTKEVLFRVSGLAAMALFLLFLTATGVPFSLRHSDIIILVLANVSFFGSLIWLAGRKNFLFRLSFIGFFIALILSSSSPGWIQNIWNYSPVPWLFHINYLKYLLIIIPGTIAGDLILRLQNNPGILAQVNKKYCFIIAALVLVLNIVMLSGLKLRLGADLFLFSVAVSLLIMQFIKKISGKRSVLYELSYWGICWLVLGLLFEPFEGGIKKDPSTISYYFITSGLAVFVLSALYILIDILDKKKFSILLIDCGRNPLAAYAGLNNLVFPLLMLLHIKVILDYIFTTPWMGVIEGMIITFFLALLTRLFTRYKIFLTA
jgi:predicted acyltransferase